MDLRYDTVINMLIATWRTLGNSHIELGKQRRKDP